MLVLNAPSCKSWRVSNITQKSIENLIRLYLGETKGDLSSTKKLHCCPSSNRGSESLGCKVGLHQASTWGHVSRREEELCSLPESCRIALRGHGRGEKRRRGERSVVEAALSKKDAGVASLIREVGVSLLLCFCSGRQYIYMSAVFASRVLPVFEIGRVPSIIKSGVSLP